MTDKKWDTDWIIFSRKTRRGGILLVILFFLIAVSPRVYQLLFVSNQPTLITKLSVDGTAFLQDEEQQNDSESTKPSEGENRLKFPTTSSNPNEFSKTEWMDMGLSEKQAESVLNFKNAIDGFSSFEDLDKVYVFDDKILKVLKENVSFDQKLYQKDDKYSPELTSNEKDTQVVAVDFETRNVYEINSASKEELLSIKGIGPFFADKIIEHRSATGGFVNLEQLLTIYNFNESNLDEVRPYLIIDINNIKKLNLNLVTLNQLKQHPDVNWDMAKSIIDLRTELGAFSSLDQLLLSIHINSKVYRQLSPYFKVD